MRIVRADLRRLERRPEAAQAPSLGLRDSAYPMSRGLSSYLDKLPDLEPRLRPGLRVLDVGAGRCRALFELGARCPGSRLVGTGIQRPEPLPPGIAFVVAAGRALPFADACFDLVVSVHGLSWELGQAAALGETLRVRRPGGVGFRLFSPFEYSSDHKLGEDCWQRVGFDRRRCAAHRPETLAPGSGERVALRRVPMRHPFGEHRANILATVERARSA